MKRRIVYGLALAAVFVAGIVFASPELLHRAGLHPEYSGPSFELPGRKALIVTTSHAVLNAPGDAEGNPTGVAASELTHPYYVFTDAGMQVDVASVKGGEIPIDPQTLSYFIRSPEDERFLEDPVLQAKVEHSLHIDDVDFTAYDAVFLAGGWGAAYDLGQSETLGLKVSEAYYADKPILGSVCHGALGFIKARDRDGGLLIEGRRMTGVSDKQVKELGIEVTPMHPETELRRAGALYESQTRFRDFLATHVVVDEEQRFVTGQNQNSGLETAHRMMAILASRETP